MKNAITYILLIFSANLFFLNTSKMFLTQKLAPKSKNKEITIFDNKSFVLNRKYASIPDIIADDILFFMYLKSIFFILTFCMVFCYLH